MGSPAEPRRTEDAPRTWAGAPVELDGPRASSPAVRAACAAVGTVALALGVVGIVVPVLPTTPFLLLAAACYARASTRLYGWLLGRSAIGPIITDWRRSRSMPPGVKRRALLVVGVTFGASILLVDPLVARAGLAATGMLLIVLLSRIPTTDR